MGRGSALDVKRAWPKLPRFFGNRVEYIRNNYIIFEPETNIGCFRVKDEYDEAADLGLIEQSVDSLSEYLRRWFLTDIEVHMPFPGIGAGQRTKEEVLPLIDSLPDNVIVYELGAQTRLP